MFRVICHSLRLRDAFFLTNWVIRTMRRISFFKHKAFLRFFRKFFYKHGAPLLSFFDCLGFFFDIRGKVGVTGNAKRRHFSFSVGKTSLSRKNLAADMHKDQLRTHTGACGVTLIIFFK